MSFLQIEEMRRRPWQPVATAATALIVLCGLADLVLHGDVSRLLGLDLGQTSLLELWRPVTFGFISYGILGTLLSALFTYWVVSSAERQFGSTWTGLVGLAAVLAVAAMLMWVAGGRGGIVGGASFISWGVVAATTYRYWRMGANVRDQLIILALCLMLNLQGGATSMMMTIAAALGGIAADHVFHEVKLARKPVDPYDAYVRERQGKRPKAAPSAAMLAGGVCVLLYLLWAVRVVLN